MQIPIYESQTFHPLIKQFEWYYNAMSVVKFFDGHSVSSMACVNRFFAEKIRFINATCIKAIEDQTYQVHWSVVRGLPPPTPIYFQIQKINKIFIEHGQGKEFKLSSRGVFSIAIRRGYIELLELIIRRNLYKCDITSTCIEGIDTFGRKRDGCCPPLRDIALLHAACFGNMSTLKYFLNPTNINIMDHLTLSQQGNFLCIKPNNDSNFSYFLSHYSKEEYDENLEEYESNDDDDQEVEIEHLVSPLVKASEYCNGGNSGQTALIHAARRNHEAMIRHLITAKADIQKVSNSGFSALMVATMHRSTEAVQLLLAAKANPNTRTELGVTPLMEAAFQNSTEYVSLLLQAKANIYLEDDQERLAWQYVNNHPKMEQLLKPNATGNMHRDMDEIRFLLGDETEEVSEVDEGNEPLQHSDEDLSNRETERSHDHPPFKDGEEGILKKRKTE